jgi:ankyrin repeat protein
LEQGAAVDGKDDYGNTALHFASQEGHTEMVRLLLENGAVVVVKNMCGETALDVTKANGHSEVATLLSERMNESRHTQTATIAATNVATSGNSNRKLEAEINQVCYMHG